ncbi:MAG: hypothetical protein PHH01_02020 [Patescibacteria group bacterium]|nr:hypothetical protein [Patescibacteria group bacterium]MDD5566948.1 hypothetical protein [Patescibacteria group bacterium]
MGYDRLVTVAMIHHYAPTISCHLASEEHYSSSRCKHITTGSYPTIIPDQVDGIVTGSRVIPILMLTTPIGADGLPDLTVPVVIINPGKGKLEVADRLRPG